MIAMSRFTVSLILGMIVPFWTAPIHAADMREALMLHGTACVQKQDSIRQTLLKHAEVKTVDAQSVPGYLLIDVAAGTVTSEELSKAVNRLYGEKDNCRAEPMQSCISPGGHQQAEHETSKTAGHHSWLP
jgi:hypothetical protein